MIYDLSSEYRRKAFRARCEALLSKAASVELTERTFRSTSQNSYLHLIIGCVAMETGTSTAYAKETYFKRLVNPDLFLTLTQDPYAGEVETVRSSAALSKEEMSLAIDRFKKWAAENGMYLPEPGDADMLRDIAAEMGRNAPYM